MLKVRWLLTALCLLLLGSAFTIKGHQTPERWKAPASADSLFSPYLIEPLTLPQAQEVYVLYCGSCHGNKGKADGIDAGKLKIKPLKFQDKLVTSQTDGALYWKIREGRGEMPSFRDLISEEQKWQLVEYIKDLSKPYDDQLNPFKGMN